MSISVAIVGRPNVGKSTLFNRLVGRRAALVDDQPGVTRDRREGRAKLGEFSFTLIDTAGLEDEGKNTLESRMMRQTAVAVESVDLVLFMVDGRAGITPVDQYFAQWLHRQGKPTILVVNKCEGRDGLSAIADAHALGFGEPVAISAEHGLGLSDLFDLMLPKFETASEPETKDEDGEGPLMLAIVGRPNVGKSTLVNRLIGEDRLVTGPEAGITRDAIALDWMWRGERICLVDTAGIRRKTWARDRIEKMSAEDSWRAVRFAQVVVLVVDSEVMLEKQDLNIAGQVIDEGRALIIAVNKWDLVVDPGVAIRKINDRLARSLPQVRGVPVVKLSALTGEGVDKLMDTVIAIRDRWSSRLSTGELNRWFGAMIDEHPPPLIDGRRLKLRYITQVKTRPPTFTIFANKPKNLPDSYLRYLANGLRDDFGLEGLPLRFHVRKGKNPYA